MIQRKQVAAENSTPAWASLPQPPPETAPHQPPPISRNIHHICGIPMLVRAERVADYPKHTASAVATLSQRGAPCLASKLRRCGFFERAAGMSAWMNSTD